MAVLCLLSVFAGKAVAQQTNFTLLYSFSGIPDGSLCFGSLVGDSNGVLYSTTTAGGTSNWGTVFKINPDGTGETILKRFGLTNGANPDAGLLLSTNGSLFGTTYNGETSNDGVVFTINRDGNGFAVLHNFAGGIDGKNPTATTLIEGNNGALYGTTYTTTTSSNRGSVFKLDKTGSNYLVLHTFTGAPDGQNPRGRLLLATDGMLYGTTVFGGTNGIGAIFSMNTNGSNYSVIYSFQSTSGGSYEPNAGLTESTNGKLYGTAYQGGSGSEGVVFSMNLGGGNFQPVRSFLSTGGDGENPCTELIEGTDGALYGATYTGGAFFNYGTVYKINKDSSGYVILHSFQGGDGQTPSTAMWESGSGVI